MAAVSRLISSRVMLTASEPVAPRNERLRRVVQVPVVVVATGAPNGASPAARYSSRMALLPVPRFWRRPTR